MAHDVKISWLYSVEPKDERLKTDLRALAESLSDDFEEKPERLPDAEDEGLYQEADESVRRKPLYHSLEFVLDALMEAIHIRPLPQKDERQDTFMFSLYIDRNVRAPGGYTGDPPRIRYVEYPCRGDGKKHDERMMQAFRDLFSDLRIKGFLPWRPFND